MRYMNIDLSTTQRVDDLFLRMSPAEKVAQLCGQIFPWGNFPAKLESGRLTALTEELAAKSADGLGSIEYLNGSLGPAESVEWANAIQRHFIENTRLGIPVLLHEEAGHGLVSQESTIFPLMPALAATWAPELVEKCFDAVGRETRALGAHQVFSPVLDLGRDARWGRQEETFGEDPFLIGKIGSAAVRGFQGGRACPDSEHVVATPKHYAGYGQSIDGLQHGITAIPERMLRDETLLPFRMAVTEGGAGGLMTAYSEIDCVPATACRRLLTEFPREQWGFDGIVVSDFGAIQQLVTRFGVAADAIEASRLALRAGCDMDLPGGEYYRQLADVYGTDRELRELIDRSVRRVLALKFRLGLFEQPYVQVERAREVVHCQAHQDLALEAARKSMILLKNDAGVLPLQAGKLKKLALLGPHAAYLNFGGVSGHARGVGIPEALAERFGDDLEVLCHRGCGLTDAEEDKLAYFPQADAKKVRPVPAELEQDTIAEAVSAASASDVAVVCIGESTQITGENFKPWPRDRESLALIGQQMQLLREVKATGTPVVVVLLHGRALAIGEVLDLADAVIDTWNPGEARGPALVDVLFGDVNPGGKLAFTIPTSAGACPVYYSKLSQGKVKGYAFETPGELLCFGFGLSYTTFSFDAPRLEASEVPVGKRVRVEVDVANTGEVTGDEVVQLYVKDMVASVARPARLLRAFERITLEPGQRRSVRFDLGSEAFRFTDINLDEVVEPGAFEIAVGPNSRDLQTIELTLT